MYGASVNVLIFSLITLPLTVVDVGVTQPFNDGNMYCLVRDTGELLRPNMYDQAAVEVT